MSFSRLKRRPAWVDLPQPSIPSKVINKGSPKNFIKNATIQQHATNAVK
jgi:hypothetical protein